MVSLTLLAMKMSSNDMLLSMIFFTDFVCYCRESGTRTHDHKFMQLILNC